MQVRRPVQCLIVLGLLAVASPFSRAQRGTSTPAQQAEIVDDWVRENYSAALHSLLPQRLELSPFPRDTKWVVVVLVNGAFAAPEYWFSVAEKYDGSVMAAIRIPRGEPLTVQMRELKKKYPAATVDAIAKMLRVDSHEISDKEAPQLRELASNLEQIKLSPVMPDFLGLDLFEYHYWTESQYGQQMSVQLVGFGPDAKEQPHPLVEWTERVRIATKSCIQDQKVQASRR